jgi:hypothetical protein
VLDFLEPVPDHGGQLTGIAGGEVAQDVFMFAQTPSVGLP